MTPVTALSPSVTPDIRLAEIARACTGAMEAVTLYPNGHPAAMTVERA